MEIETDGKWKGAGVKCWTELLIQNKRQTNTPNLQGRKRLETPGLEGKGGLP